MHSSIPAVVVGGTLIGLGVVRSPCQGYTPLFVVEGTRQRAACWSRYCRFVGAPSLAGTPLVKTLVLAGMVERAVRADTIADAEQVARRILGQAPRLIVKEWIDGPETEIFFSLFSCDRDGRLLGLFRGHKLVCLPPMVGTTAVCATAPEAAAELTTQTQRFIERVTYRGLGGLEFRRDSRTGQFVIIEPTVGRTDWQEEIATLCGINLPLLTYRAEIGLPLAAPPSLAPGSPAWRSPWSFRPPLGSLHPKAKLVDGSLRWVDRFRPCTPTLTRPACAGFGDVPSTDIAASRWQASRRREVGLDAAIIGSGPYGLSIAAHLRAAKRPLESWRAFMPQGMILKSALGAPNRSCCIAHAWETRRPMPAAT